FLYTYMDEIYIFFVFFFQAEDGIRDRNVTGVQTCALRSGPLYPVLYTDEEKTGSELKINSGPENRKSLLDLARCFLGKTLDQKQDRKSVVKGKSEKNGGDRDMKKRIKNRRGEQQKETKSQ